jgi:hypothetical protein
VLKRLPITHKKEEVLSPIEVAIDEMKSKVNSLFELVHNPMCDIKRLQLVLHGSVNTQVCTLTIYCEHYCLYFSSMKWRSVQYVVCVCHVQCR